ncbi:hypothetical protein ALP98_02122 [Pseudomonas viridiflava]|uniref:Uncharacterized protein n=2 Tax=Pseudomonas syringae group TaxID=136849 RepID=A0A3M4P4M5_PSEVI|nr:hypothetical protein ALQ09_00977 [Pseudomonas viridiflava]RMQ73211.1 hypothetical protein ALP98_02122 [Pseudomonas viridiflava]RMR53290.1 hypothetical protein ALP83_02400 [Pseudomonas syringae pv. actinidiae]
MARNPARFAGAGQATGVQCRRTSGSALINRNRMLRVWPYFECPRAERMTMTDQKDEKKPEPANDVPAHSTPEEKERLKDFNKGGIPPGAC